MTYIVLSGALNSTHSLVLVTLLFQLFHDKVSCFYWRLLESKLIN